jgi:hypothetical protein
MAREDRLQVRVNWIRTQLRFIAEGATEAPSTTRQREDARDSEDRNRADIRAYLDRKEGAAARATCVAFALAKEYPDAVLEHRIGSVFGFRMLGITSGGSSLENVLSYWALCAEHEIKTGVSWADAQAALRSTYNSNT